MRSPETELDVPDGFSPSFEDLMILVFSGPMCFECLEEGETEDGKEESDKRF